MAQTKSELIDGENLSFKDSHENEKRNMHFSPTITKENIIISGSIYLIGLYYNYPLIMMLALISAIISVISNELYIEYKSLNTKQEENTEDARINRLKEKYANEDMPEYEFEFKLEKLLLDENKSE